ncbi:MAG: tagatose 1,6-diphosphate aldolase [Deinococcales bacterium]
MIHPSIKTCVNDQGIIAASAMDQRGSLQNSLAKRGLKVTSEHLKEFKSLVSEVLSPESSAILLDPLYGLEAAQTRAEGCGLILAYEKSGYDNSREGRLPDLLEGWSVRRLVETGAQGIKLLVYYNPFDEMTINQHKQAFVERVGSECKAEGVGLWLEPLSYNDKLDDLALAKAKPDYIKAIVQEFSKERYQVGILKIEFPILIKHLEGMGGENLYSRQAAKAAFKALDEVSNKPYIFLSAGVDMPLFLAGLELAAEAGSQYNGVLCGRATWKDAIPIYAQQGALAMRQWLENQGLHNLRQLNDMLKGAKALHKDT